MPKGTPDDVRMKLADAMAKAAQSDAFMKLATSKGFTVAPTGHEAFSAYLAAEDVKVKEIFKSAGLYKTK